MGGHVGHPPASGQGCVTWSWQLPSHFPEGPHLLSEGGESQACHCTSSGPDLAQAGLALWPPPVSATLPRLQAGASWEGAGLGFSLCLCVCSREVGQVEPTGKQARWRDGGCQPCPSMSGAMTREEEMSQTQTIMFSFQDHPELLATSACTTLSSSKGGNT